MVTGLHFSEKGFFSPSLDRGAAREHADRANSCGPFNAYFLHDISCNDSLPREVRDHARALLRHFPSAEEIILRRKGGVFRGPAEYPAPLCVGSP
ncbi:BPSL0761 family protein [Pseudomonas aeruginosa]